MRSGKEKEKLRGFFSALMIIFLVIPTKLTEALGSSIQIVSNQHRPSCPLPDTFNRASQSLPALIPTTLTTLDPFASLQLPRPLSGRPLRAPLSSSRSAFTRTRAFHKISPRISTAPLPALCFLHQPAPPPQSSDTFENRVQALLQNILASTKSSESTEGVAACGNTEVITESLVRNSISNFYNCNVENKKCGDDSGYGNDGSRSESVISSQSDDSTCNSKVESSGGETGAGEVHLSNARGTNSALSARVYPELNPSDDLSKLQAASRLLEMQRAPKRSKRGSELQLEHVGQSQEEMASWTTALATVFSVLSNQPSDQTVGTH